MGTSAWSRPSTKDRDAPRLRSMKSIRTGSRTIRTIHRIRGERGVLRILRILRSDSRTTKTRHRPSALRARCIKDLALATSSVDTIEQTKRTGLVRGCAVKKGQVRYKNWK